MVICLERGADLHMAPLMPTASEATATWRFTNFVLYCIVHHSLSLASVKSRLVLPFWYQLARVVPDKGALNTHVCVFITCLLAEMFIGDASE